LFKCPVFTRQGLYARHTISIRVLTAALAPLMALPITSPALAQAVSQQAAQSWAAAVDRAAGQLGLAGIAQARAQEGAALDNLARSRFAGPLEADGGLRQDALGSGFGYVEAEFGLMAPLWRRGERDLLRSQASAGGALARASQTALKLEAAGEVRARWWALAAARAAASEDARQAGFAREVVTVTSRLVDGGEMARLDLRQAEIAAADAARRAEESAAEAEAARIAFAALVGEPAPMLGEEAQGPATGEHPLVLLASAQAQSLRSRQALASASGAPRWMVGVDVRAERGMRGDDLGVSTGVRAARALGTVASARAGGAALGSEAAQADANLRRVTLDAEAGIAQARARLASSRAALRHAEMANAAASEALALTERGRREGELSFLEELRARNAAADAARTLALARVAASAAISNLNQAYGLLP
jgi:outer membrane protein, heavy metal efflux system